MANRRVKQKNTKPPQIQTNVNKDFEFPDIEQQIKYELELNWCVRKLQIGISNEKDPKKYNDAIKFLDNLNSKNVSVIRKRQIMHNLFGDYRKKMINEDKLGQTKIAFKENEKLDSIVNSKFLRKSTTKIINKKELNNLKDLNEDMNNLELNVEEEKKENYYKMSTGNSNFTFNFKIDPENDQK